MLTYGVSEWWPDEERAVLDLKTPEPSRPDIVITQPNFASGGNVRKNCRRSCVQSPEGPGDNQVHRACFATDRMWHSPASRLVHSTSLLLRLLLCPRDQLPFPAASASCLDIVQLFVGLVNSNARYDQHLPSSNLTRLRPRLLPPNVKPVINRPTQFRCDNALSRPSSLQIPERHAQWHSACRS